MKMGYSLHFGFMIATLLLSFGLAADSSASKLYWKTKLPNTPMPKAVADALAMEDAKGHEWANSGEVVNLPYEDEPGHCKQEALINGTDFVPSKFFLAKDLAMGAKLTVHLKDGGISTRFPSPRLAHTIPPFKSTSLSENLHFFSVEPESKAAMIMNITLTRCERQKPINGKWQLCATSLEKLASYVASTLGSSDDVKAVSLSLPAFHLDALLQYKIVRINQLATEEYMVSCHRLGFPYAVFYCHQPKGTTLYSISLLGVQDEAKIDAFTVCHSDTTGWSPKFVGLETLGVQPGTPICHFLQFHDVVWYRTSQVYM